jgi:2-C-methyl-D-erythritol 4-phosphate cytidylyltransferase
MRASAIVVAAGSGTRLGLQTPKAFVHFGEYTLLARVLRTLARVTTIEEAVIAIPAGAEAATRTEVHVSGLEIPVKITPGGVARQDSVRIALALTSAEAELVVVHDAARPFATTAMFEAALEAAARAGGAIVAIPVVDSLKDVSGRTIASTIQRAGLWQAQTPQAFRREILVQAHRCASHKGIIATDEADLVQRIGSSVEVVEGSALNLKITTPDDLRIGEAIASMVFPR